MPKVRRSMFDDNDREQMPDTPKKDMEQKPITTKTSPDSDFSEATGDTSGTGANSFEQNTTPITDVSGNGNNPPPPPPPPPASDPLIPDSTGMEFNPLSGKVIHRDHTVAPGAENSRVEERVEEPKYEVPPPPPPKKDPNVTPGQPVPPQNPNPGITDLPKKDQHLAATQLVDSLLGGYKWVWQGASNWAKVSDVQLNEWNISGKINKDVRIVLGTEEVTMLEFYTSYNSQADDAFVVTEEFISIARPPLVRIFEKKNWGITDEQFVMQLFARDTVSKLGALYQLKNTLKQINNAVFKQYEDIKKKAEELVEREERLRKAEAAAKSAQPRQERPTQQQQPPQQQRRTPPRQQPPAPEPEVEVTPPTQQRPTGGGGLVQSFEIPDNDGSDITEIPYVDTNSDKTEE